MRCCGKRLNKSVQALRRDDVAAACFFAATTLDGAVSRALHLSILRRHGACPACEAPQRRTNLISPPLFWKSTISCSPCTGWIIQFQPASSSKSDKPLAITRGPSRIERKTPSAPIMSCQVGSIHSTERHFRSSALGFSSTHRRSSRRVCGDAFTGHLTSCITSFESSMSSLQVLGLRTRRPSGAGGHLALAKPKTA